MVAAPGLLELLFICFELFLRLKEGAIDTLQHGVLLAAPPVSAGDAHELEGGDLARMVHVSTTAEVSEVSVRALGDVAVLDVLEEIEFEGLLTPTLFGYGTRNRRHLKGVLAFDGGAHALFEPGEILLREWAGQAEIIVEARVDGRPDPEFSLGHKLKHGLGEHVGGGMPHAGQALGLRKSFKSNVGFEWCGHGSPPLAASTAYRNCPASLAGCIILVLLALWQ